MKRIHDDASLRYQPPFTYVHPEDGYKQFNGRVDLLKRDVKIYRRANNYPISSNFNQDFEENVCFHAPENYCDDFIPPTELEKLSTLEQFLYRRAESGLKLRTAQQVESIVAICRACQYYGGESGYLRVACAKCGCQKKRQYVSSEICPDTPPRWT